MYLRTRPRTSIALALILGLASVALSAEPADEQARRLDDHFFFVQSIGRGWEPLLADMERTLGSIPKAPPERTEPIRSLGDRVRETIATTRALDGTESGEARALELFEVLGATAVKTEQRPKFRTRSADITMTQAERAETRDKDDKKALALASRSLEHVPAYPRAVDMIGRLGFKVAGEYRKDEQFESALKQFAETLAALRLADAKESSPKFAEGRKEIDAIKATTGTFAVAWLGDPQALARVKGPVATYTNAVLTFSPAAGGRVPLTAQMPRLVKTGKYTVKATPPGGGEAQTVTLDVTPQGGEMVLLAAKPQGMVVVPAAGGADAFLIDRTEVSNAQWSQGGGSSRGGSQNAAVAGVTFAEAKAWAEKNGKRLPTLAEWTHAAFGAPNSPRPRYPWGDNGNVGTSHVVQNASSAQDVESAPQGASPSGAINMVGNVWEWLDIPGGWLIGYGWNLERTSELDADMEWPPGTPDAPWRADLLRVPIPSPAGYDQITDSQQRRKYSANIAQAEGALSMAGLRCIVPLGKPRR